LNAKQKAIIAEHKRKMDNE
jgi:DNA-binding beta-propeller fold protein YncE